MMNEFVREAYIAARESDTGEVSPHYGDEYDTWLRALKEDSWEEGYTDAGGLLDD